MDNGSYYSNIGFKDDNSFHVFSIKKETSGQLFNQAVQAIGGGVTRGGAIGGGEIEKSERNAC